MSKGKKEQEESPVNSDEENAIKPKKRLDIGHLVWNMKHSGFEEKKLKSICTEIHNVHLEFNVCNEHISEINSKNKINSFHLKQYREELDAVKEQLQKQLRDLTKYSASLVDFMDLLEETTSKLEGKTKKLEGKDGEIPTTSVKK